MHAGGNGARHIHAALEGSLRRLRTDFIDLYWVHVWDSVTPPEELLETMSGLVRAGKIRYWGMSNAPAWYVATLVALASRHGLPGPIALQYFYSLVSREVEAEHLPLARHAGLGMMPWSPLAYGLLTGKYDRPTVEAGAPRTGGLPSDAGAGEARAEDDKRLDGANPFGDTLFTDRNWRIVDVLHRVAKDMGETPARVALAWVLSRPGVDTALMGVSRVSQLQDNIAATDLQIPAEADRNARRRHGAGRGDDLWPVHTRYAPAGGVRRQRRLITVLGGGRQGGFFRCTPFSNANSSRPRPPRPSSRSG